MPSVGATEPTRIVIDESSLDFEGVLDIEVEYAIDDFNDALSSLLETEVPVGKSPFCLEHECRAGVPLYSFLYEHAVSISRDTRLRCGILLDRCVSWEDDISDVPSSVVLSGTQVESWSLGYAVVASSTRCMACLSCNLAGRRGVLTAAAGGRKAELFFFARAMDMPTFWQWVLQYERIAQDDFFHFAGRAFPQLVMHPDLDFRRFQGSYADVYGWVVGVFVVLNNHFAESVRLRRGVRQSIETDMRSYGIDVSPESPQTHKQGASMRQREVLIDGVAYKCEWHAKRLWNVDRIHFALPDARPDGRIVVGIFTDHLDT